MLVVGCCVVLSVPVWVGMPTADWLVLLVGDMVPPSVTVWDEDVVVEGEWLKVGVPDGSERAGSIWALLEAIYHDAAC